MANVLINNATNDNNNLVLGKTNHMQVQLYTSAAASGLVASDASGTPNIGIYANGEGGNIRFLSRDKKYHWEMDAYNNTQVLHLLSLFLMALMKIINISPLMVWMDILAQKDFMGI